MTEDTDLWDEATNALLRSIVSQAHTSSPTNLLKLAEALAWLRNPAQAHGAGQAE